jgi:transcriptional regulator with XRE-family HTH domain
MNAFPQALKTWRHTRRLSQLALATEAAISSRHVSFLETGRARPSRGMVLHLADVLAVPRAGRNALLTAAGFAPAYPAHTLDDDAMAPVREAIDWTIARHAPYPAVVMDRLWHLVSLNRPATQLFAGLGLGPGDSLLDAIMAPDGPSRFIENWPEVAYHTLLRLRAESAAGGGISVLDAAADHLAADPAIAAWQPPDILPAIVPTIYNAGGLRLSLMSTYAQFGTAEEVALADMKIELMFPADPQTRDLLQRLGAGNG